MLLDEPLQLPDESGVASERQVRLHPLLEGLQAQLLQTPDLALSELVACKVGEWRAPPERERLAERQRS